MDSRADQNDWFCELFGSALFGKQGFVEYCFVFFGGLIVGGDGEQVNVPLFGAVGEDFLMEVKLLMTVVFVETVQIFAVSGVTVGEGEGELYFVGLVFEQELKNHLQLAILPQYQRRLGRNAGPF